MEFKMKNKYDATSLVYFILISLVILSPEAAFALAGTVGAGVCELAGDMTGTVGQGIATIAVVFLGIGAFFGKTSWGLAIMFGAGIAAIFSATTLVGIFGGSGC